MPISNTVAFGANDFFRFKVKHILPKLKNILLCSLFILIAAQSFGATKRCLFIGDSYFSHNDLSRHFLDAWNAESTDTLLISNHNRNGANIQVQWQYYREDLSGLLESRMWDFVVIQLPQLAKPQESILIQILHSVDSLLTNCTIICITMDIYKEFPELVCVRDVIEGVRCNKFTDSIQKLDYVRESSENIVQQVFKNQLEIVPFSHYRYYLYTEFSVVLDSDDDYGHPSPFSQSVLAGFTLFHVLDISNDADNLRAYEERTGAINLSSFYASFYDEQN